MNNFTVKINDVDSWTFTIPRKATIELDAIKDEKELVRAQEARYCTLLFKEQIEAMVRYLNENPGE